MTTSIRTRSGLRALALTLLIALVSAPALAQNLTITARMVTGGVNDLQVQWLREYVIPEFESRNPGVTVEILEFGGSDEALKEQYALDLSVGAGA
nr:ABC transporter substrate-binding protein [Trueperaceae bacterium]